ncbi:MAG: SecF protein [Microgenomates group bacterium GW2011_GWC1_41_8]|uniref:Protein-export membrane protein SecF n=1 Tax=Candidatus Roizmanbacteria bacterium GW2011_GWA1_41_13 TaxID=1618474 RepID=A0A0G0V2J2_9BACT|nr:MAG: SecF protein [Candidatus Levybacteria bacterium GW2011_GWA2_40_16]KKR93966.1 MAG: SecF protein [Candidatus Roizmanbacteria bacterium GW2011_GWA1_41_13]KKS23682.1 MAG: SecF protein [Microgenomates group bacterium GW2011_GWC1_41_8]OGK48386.1 MAG: protein-export membrane protein SecF [Candidatus Roizmanbacteria bacterium RIFCSPLOWO2_01_FULL_40_14]
MINFLKYRQIYLAISLAVLVPGVYSLLNWGLKPSIDFSGGTVVEITNYELGITNLEDKLKEKNVEIESIRQDNDIITVRTKPIDRSVWEEVKTELATESAQLQTEESTASAGLEELRFETVGPVLGKELLNKTLIAASIAIVVILLYVAWAFKSVTYGISAVIALFHDVLVVTGTFSLLGHFFGVEVDVLFVTALLTTMSFSVHDTIVVFDRIRESIRTEKLPFDATINKALSETMSRSVNNSMTIIFMLLALVLLGGDTVKWFAVALLIGTISGTYSSPFVATPILYLLQSRKHGN